MSQNSILNKSSKYVWLLFMLSPAFVVVSSMINFRKSWSKNILWAFVAFFGLTFAIGHESEGSDIVRYVAEMASLYEVVLSWEGVVQYFSASGELDIMRTVIAIVLSRFTDSQVILTTVYAIIFGYFYSRNIFYLLNQLQGKLSRWTWLLIIIFMLIIPFWNINGFRFWTAAHVFLYGLLPYLFEKKKKMMMFCFISLLFHFSFVVPLISLLFFTLIPKKLNLLIVLFIASIVYNEINVQLLEGVLEKYTFETLIERTDAYTSEESIKSFRETGEGSAVSTKSWYAVWYQKSFNYVAITLMLVLFWVNFSKKILTKPLVIVFAFTLWFYSLANILSTIPSGGRFISLAQLVFLFLLILVYQNHYRRKFSELFFPVFTPIFLMFIIVSIRTGFYFISFATVFGNPISAIIGFEKNISLNDIIK